MSNTLVVRFKGSGVAGYGLHVTGYGLRVARCGAGPEYQKVRG